MQQQQQLPVGVYMQLAALHAAAAAGAFTAEIVAGERSFYLCNVLGQQLQQQQQQQQQLVLRMQIKQTERNNKQHKNEEQTQTVRS